MTMTHDIESNLFASYASSDEDELCIIQRGSVLILISNGREWIIHSTGLQ